MVPSATRVAVLVWTTAQFLSTSVSGFFTGDGRQRFLQANLRHEPLGLDPELTRSAVQWPWVDLPPPGPRAKPATNSAQTFLKADSEKTHSTVQWPLVELPTPPADIDQPQLE